MRATFFLVCFTLIIALFAQDLNYDEDTLVIKPYLADPSSCLSCHTEADKSFLQDTALSCDALCLSCHRDITQAHHPVGIRNKRTDISFVLTKYGRIGCRTCHNLHIRRYDTVSWKSETLYQRFFNRREKYKTYYLLRKNTNGELCRQCHD